MAFEEQSLPVIVEPSQVYCRADGKICKHRSPSMWCMRAYRDIPPSTDPWKAPDWCPLKLNALFGLSEKEQAS